MGRSLTIFGGSAIDMWSAGMILMFFLTGKFPLFHASDDVEALVEIATIIGRRKMEKAATLHSTCCLVYAKTEFMLTSCHRSNIPVKRTFYYPRRYALAGIRREAKSQPTNTTQTGPTFLSLHFVGTKRYKASAFILLTSITILFVPFSHSRSPTCPSKS